MKKYPILLFKFSPIPTLYLDFDVHNTNYPNTQRYNNPFSLQVQIVINARFSKERRLET